MLSPLDNETIFKAAFTDKTVFKAFVKDIIGIDIEVDKIETEKKFEPKVGNIDFSYDIFAESTDHRVIVEIQKIDYDYNFDRFLHYFIMAIAELQRRAAEYKIEQTVYSVVILTAPYKLDKKTSRTIRDEVLITSVNPRNLQDKIIPLFGHKLIFLNHHFKNKNTPANYLDWLNLFYESTHNPEKYTLNLENKGIKKAVELIDFEKLSPQQRHNMKIDAQRKVVRRLNQEEGFDKGKKEGIEEGKKEGIEEGKKEGIEEGKKEGIEEGKKEGIEEGKKEGIEEGKKEGKVESKREIAKKSLEKGIPPDLVADITGLSVEEIETL